MLFGEKSNKSRLYKSFERKQAPSPENNAFYCFSSLFDVNCNFYNVCLSALLESRLSDGPSGASHAVQSAAIANRAGTKDKKSIAAQGIRNVASVADRMIKAQ